MSKFPNHDVRAWLDGVLSQHPESPTETETMRGKGGISNFAFSVALAASVITMSGLPTAMATQQQHASVRSSLPSAIDEADKVYWFGSAPNVPAISTTSISGGFESYFNEIHGQLLAGGLLDVPTETRQAAKLALLRSAPDNDWVAKLASELSKLTD